MMPKTNLRIEKLELPTGKAADKVSNLAAVVKGHLDKLAEWRDSRASNKNRWGAFK